MDQAHIIKLVLVLFMLVLSLGVHEAAHAWAALKCGDTTARDMGRITLNPIPHIDPFMSILFPAMLYLMSGGQFVFGGARPVPVNFHRLRNPWRDMSLVALAGPVSNVLQAIFYAVLWRVAVKYGNYGSDTILAQVLSTTVHLNLVLAALNMIPVPPLDGSRVLAWILPPRFRDTYVQLERFGMLLVLLLFFFGPMRFLIGSALGPLYSMVDWISTLGGLW